MSGGDRRSVCIGVLTVAVLTLLYWEAISRRAWITYAGFDQAVYAAMAGLWRFGFIPYRDVYDNKPPGMVALLRCGFVLWGDDAESGRRVLLGLAWVGTLALFAGFWRRGWRSGAVLGAAVLTALMVIRGWTYLLLESEMPCASFTALACGAALLATGPRERPWAAVSGAAWVAAGLSKQPGAFALLPLAVTLCYERGRLRRLIAFGAGAAAVGCVVLAYFGVQHAIPAMWEATVTHAAGQGVGATGTWWYLASRSWWTTNGIPKALDFAAEYKPYALPILALPLTTVLAPSWLALLAWLWLLTAWVMITAGGHADGHYVVMAYPALAVVASAVAEGIGPNPLAGLVLAVLLLFEPLRTGYVPQLYIPIALRANPDPVDAKLRAQAARIREAAQPGDRLFVEGENFHLYLYAGLPPATRYLYESAPGSHQARLAMFDDPPRWLAVSRLTQAYMEGAVPMPPWSTTIVALLRDRYTLVDADPVGAIYRRND